MREAFGGTAIMYIIIIFIVIYVTFLAETLKYIQAYRVKNQIINYIEQYEGFNEDVIAQLGDEPEAEGYLKRVNYNESSLVKNELKGKYTTDLSGIRSKQYCSETYGYCVSMEYYDDSQDTYQAYYKVTTFLSLDFSVQALGIPPIYIEVSGETRLIKSSLDDFD